MADAFRRCGIGDLPADYIKNNSKTRTRQPCLRHISQPCHTQTASHPLIWCTSEGQTVRCLYVQKTAKIMGFPLDWMLPTTSRAAIKVTAVRLSGGLAIRTTQSSHTHTHTHTRHACVRSRTAVASNQRQIFKKEKLQTHALPSLPLDTPPTPHWAGESFWDARPSPFGNDSWMYQPRSRCSCCVEGRAPSERLSPACARRVKAWTETREEVFSGL